MSDTRITKPDTSADISRQLARLKRTPSASNRTMKHTPTPWKPTKFGQAGSYGASLLGPADVSIAHFADNGTYGKESYSITKKEAEANAARAAECVNACAGIQDPAKAIEDATQALGLLCEFAKNKGWEGSAWDDAKAALQLLTPKP